MKKRKLETEYLVVTDRDSKVLKSFTGRAGYYEAVKLVNLLRRAGGEVTLFKSTAA